MTSSEFLQDGIRYIPSKAAAKGAGLSADYISRLCRESQVTGTWHRGAWYVHEPSLVSFVEEKRKRQDELTRQQTEKLKREREEAEMAARRADTLAKWRKRARPIALATITLLLATSATALARPAYEHIAPQLPADAKAQLASVATSFESLRNLASTIASSITETIGNLLAPVQQSPTPIVFVPQAATSSPTQISQSNSQPPSQANQPSRVIERVVESVRTIVSGGISEAMLDARLAALDKDLSTRITQVALAGAYQTNRTYDVLARTSRVEDPANVTLDVDASDITGVVGIAHGGTGTSTSPSYGQLLVGNALGGYDLVATSSLGIEGSGAGGASFGQAWEIANDALAPTTTVGIIVSASSTFASLSTAHATVTNATSTSLFASLARFTTGIIDTLTAVAATITNLTATTLTAQNASTTVASAYDGIFVGRTATTTIRGDAATSTFSGGVETTALDVTGATSTFANGIQLAGGCFLDANGSCITSGGGGGAAWGGISGTLSDQSDLQSALDAKLSLADWYATTTDALAEGSNNRYYADALVQTYLDGLDKGFFFATTSADYWQTTRNFFSTTSADYYVSVTDLFSTTSANYFAHSSTTIPKTYTANVFTALQTFENASTTNLSASYASSTQGFFGSLSVGNLTGFLKATAGAIATAAIDLASDVTGILGVARGGTGWASIASAAIPYGNGSGQLATTTAGTNGQVLALLDGVPTWTATTTFSSPLLYANGNVTLDTSGNWSGTFDGEEGSYYLNAANLANFGTPFFSFFSATTTSALAEGSNLYWTNARFDARLAATTSLPNLTTLAALSITESQISNLTHYTNADTQAFIHASTTIPKTYSANTWTDNNIFSSLTLGSFNGPLHANAGLLSATTSIGVLYGGTGLTSAPSYGQVLLGQSNGTYQLVATSSLGITAGGALFDYPFPQNATSTLLSFNGGLLSLASTTIGNGTQAGGVTISGGATTTGFLVVQGSATSTFAGGINITSGCFAVSGTCLGEDTAVKLTAIRTGTNTANWSKPSNLSYVIVELWGGGGGGGGAGTSGGGGGGAGGYILKSFTASALSATTSVQVTIGAGGNGHTGTGTGSTGGTSNFGSMATSTGGSGGDGDGGGGGAGGVGIGGDLNLSGGGGGGGDSNGSGVGGNAPRGGGGGGGGGSDTGADSNAGGDFGGGGGGGQDDNGNGGSGGAGGYVIYEYTTEPGGADLAENYPIATPEIEAGDIVSFDGGIPLAVKRAVIGERRPIAGVISSKPGIVLGEEGVAAAGMRPVALAGRVPVKFSPENGGVQLGDRIAVSSTPGVGMKAGPFDDSVGTVIAPVERAATGDIVMIFMDLQRGMDVDAIGDALLAPDNDNAPTTTASSPDDAAASSTPPLVYLNAFLRQLVGKVARWLADAENGITKIVTDLLASKRGEFEELCVGSVCVTEADFMATFGAAASALPGSAGPPTDTATAAQPSLPDPATTTESVPSSPSNSNEVEPPISVSSTTPDTPADLTEIEQSDTANSTTTSASAQEPTLVDVVSDALRETGQPEPANDNIPQDAPTEGASTPEPANDNTPAPSAEAI